MVVDVLTALAFVGLGLAIGFLLLVFFIELQRVYDEERIAPGRYFLGLVTIIVLYLGGGTAASGVILNRLVQLGGLPLGLYLTGLNVMFLPAALYFYIARFKLDAGRG